MIGRLKGIVDELGDGWAVVDVNGVGYRVFCSSRTLESFFAGEFAVIEVETHVREDHIHLYGFGDSTEKEWFKLLTMVQGVGAKVGLAILGVLGPEELINAISTSDSATISRAPGVGKKLATRIASELKDKIGAVALGAALNSISSNDVIAASDRGSSGVIAEATSALVNLGYGPSEALSVVARAAEELGDNVTIEGLIRNGLKVLAPSDPRGKG